MLIKIKNKDPLYDGIFCETALVENIIWTQYAQEDLQ